MVSVYVLRLHENKWYIGSSKNIYERVGQHFKGCGCDWTRRYPPIDIHEVLPNREFKDEDSTVKQYMIKYGISNVRGGSYSRFKLMPSEKSFLIKEFCTASNSCFNCARPGHYANECIYAKHSFKIYKKHRRYKNQKKKDKSKENSLLTHQNQEIQNKDKEVALTEERKSNQDLNDEELDYILKDYINSEVIGVQASSEVEMAESNFLPESALEEIQKMIREESDQAYLDLDSLSIKIFDLHSDEDCQDLSLKKKRLGNNDY